MPTLTISPPSAKQELFLKADTKHVGFGGARGGGKSWSVRTKAKLLALNFAGIRELIVRRTYAKFTELGVGYRQNARGVNYFTQLFIY